MPVDSGTPQAPPVASTTGLQHGHNMWEPAVRRTLDTAAQVVTSPAFRDNVLAIKDFHASPDDPKPLAGAAVLQEYLGLPPAVRPYPTSYEPKWGKALGLIPTGLAGCGPDPFVRGSDQTADTVMSGNAATTFLNSCTIERASRPKEVAGFPEEFACAINTIAHEWTHAVPVPDKPGTQLFLDAGHRSASGKLVSYTIGAVAQCTYLNSLSGQVNVPACIDAAGTTVFRANSCKKGWSSHPPVAK